MKKVYFAGPLFCKGEKDFNLFVASILEKAGYKVFLPQRDGHEAAALTDLPQREKIELIFNKDTTEIKNCDVFFMVLDGRVPDDGACVELGIAYTLGKKCYGLKTDVRALEIDMDLNPLIAGCFYKIFYNQDGNALIEELQRYLNGQEL